MLVLPVTFFVSVVPSSVAACNPTPTPDQLDAVCQDFCSGHCDFNIKVRRGIIAAAVVERRIAIV